MEDATTFCAISDATVIISCFMSFMDMKQEMITVASLMAQKVVASSITAEIQSTLVDETLKEMGESTWQN